MTACSYRICPFYVKNKPNLYCRVGIILNHILNHFLKKYFAEPRPMLRDVVFEVSPLLYRFCINVSVGELESTFFGRLLSCL